MAAIKQEIDVNWTVAPDGAEYYPVPDIASVSPSAAGDYLTSPHTQRRYHLLTATDARADRPPIVAMVENIIMPNALGVWVGAFGVGKTWALLDLGVCVAMGMPWLGYKVQQGGVLVIDEESGERRISDRMKLVLDGHEAPPDTPIYYTSFNNLNFFSDPERSGKDLVWLIHAHNIKLVIVDALTDVSIPAKENDSEEIGLVMKTLRLIADVTGASLQLLHHENKIGAYRGSTNIPALSDLVIGIKKEPKATRMDFSFIKARDVEAFDFSAEMNFTPGKFWLSSANAPTRSESFSKSEAYVLRALENGPASIEDIVAGADTCSPEAARRAVYALASRNKITRTNPGSRGAAATYGKA